MTRCENYKQMLGIVLSMGFNCYAVMYFLALEVEGHGIKVTQQNNNTKQDKDYNRYDFYNSV
jgi:hypothetical protein